MKVKEARKLCEGLEGKELYKLICDLYKTEVDRVVQLRAHGREPSEEVVKSAVDEVGKWITKVAEDLPLSESGTIDNIVSWESGETYVRYHILDPKLKEWGIRTRREATKGTPLPMLEAMTGGDLEAASSMMMAQVRASFEAYGLAEDEKKKFAAKIGRRICPYGADERFCEHQDTYSMAENIPRSTSDLVFICTVEKCIKETRDDQQQG